MLLLLFISSETAHVSVVAWSPCCRKTCFETALHLVARRPGPLHYDATLSRGLTWLDMMRPPHNEYCPYSPDSHGCSPQLQRTQLAAFLYGASEVQASAEQSRRGYPRAVRVRGLPSGPGPSSKTCLFPLVLHIPPRPTQRRSSASISL